MARVATVTRMFSHTIRAASEMSVRLASLHTYDTDLGYWVRADGTSVKDATCGTTSVDEVSSQARRQKRL